VQPRIRYSPAVAGLPDQDEPPKRSALDQLPLKQRVLAERRGFLRAQASRAGTDEAGVNTLGIIVVLVVALGLVVGVIALGAAVR
jgi:hypothetical protein